VNRKKNIIILGTSGNSRDILDTIRDINAFSSDSVFQCTGFLDDNESRWGKSVEGVKVLGPISSAKDFNECYFVNGIGSTSTFWKRGDITAKSGVPDERFASLVHPTASVSKTADLGFGTVIFPHVTVTSSAKIGNHVLVLPNTVISHDDIIGDHTCIAAGVCISGAVRIGKLCYLGSGSSIIESVEIGDRCLVGMGSVVLKKVPENSVVAGNPAKYLRASVV
jgi:sugar O-acyltransferase (sialic acid O-acetyltransferase NeuD family)